jgi:hypothetical protein
MKQSDLQAMFEKMIDSARFNAFEMMGFSKNPRNALIVGIAMGYQAGIARAKEVLTPSPPAPEAFTIADLTSAAQPSPN